MEISRGGGRIIAIGAGGALAAGLIIAAVITLRDQGPRPPPPASQGGLMIQTGRDDDIKLDPRRPLRCFVAGKLVGELLLADCARRNGVAAGALDVGLDPSGALAASNGASADLTPLPPSPAVVAAETPPDAAQSEAAAPDSATPPISDAPHAGQGACWRYASAAWRRLPADMSLGACVQSLYDGQCERPGGATYGRWGDRTLRRTAGRIEISADNRSFRFLADQGSSCAIGPLASHF